MRTLHTFVATTPYERERRFFYLALALLVITVAAYMYFLCASVVHVVMRKEIDKELGATGSYVSQLEAQYIEAQHSMSEEIAGMQGYVEAHDKIFIDRSDTNVALSRN